MIHQKHLDDIKEQYNTKKYKFQQQSARSIRWSDFDNDWLEEKFSTRQPDFYNFFNQKY